MYVVWLKDYKSLTIYLNLSLKTIVVVSMFQWLFLFCAANCILLPKSCPNIKLNEIPSDHLFHRKPKPLVIAHRGLPKEFQENTYDGIIASLDSNADGFELDIYKTKDDKLVVFHDDNTKVFIKIRNQYYCHFENYFSLLTFRVFCFICRS